MTQQQRTETKRTKTKGTETKGTENVKEQELRETGRELLWGIVGFGLFLQVILLPFPAKSANAAGLWIGVGMALFTLWHMWASLERASLLEGEAANRLIRSRYAIRYLCSGLVLALALYVGKGKISVWTLLLGVSSLKAAAYLQPGFHRLLAVPERGGEKQ